MTGNAALTRRRMADVHRETWRIFYGDVAIGTIGVRAGVPVDVDQWDWCCGLSTGGPDSPRAGGTAPDFLQARTDFEKAWRGILPHLTEADFEEVRRDRARTAWKYAMWDAGCKMPTQQASGRSRCFCGAEIDVWSTSQHVYEAHMEIAAAAA